MREYTAGRAPTPVHTSARPRTRVGRPSPAEAPTVLRGRVITPTGELTDGVVVFTDRISWVGPTEASHYKGVPWRDVTVIPGLVDAHCHGGGGVGFPEAADSAHARQAVREHLSHGTTSQIASLVTASPGTLLRQCELLAELVDAGDLLGVHLEGPFLSPGRCGAQDPAFMLPGDPRLVREVVRATNGHLATMTIAPEVAGVLGPDGVIEALASAGALPSFGHTDASAEIFTAAVAAARAALVHDRQLPTITHLFNGMPPLHHRNPGPVAAALAAGARGEAVVELVADGVHLAPGTVSAVFDIVPDGAVMLVTDAIAATGMPDGDYVLGRAPVTVSGGVARLTGTRTLAGSTAHLLDVVRATVDAGVPLRRAVRAASTTPATVLGHEDVGSLEAGRSADVVVLDVHLRAVDVYRRGRRVGADIPA